VEEYRAKIVLQKQKARDAILLALQKTRESYELIKTFTTKRKRDAEAHISKALASDDFEVFYPYFDMKSKLDKSFLAPSNIPKEQLAQTEWMRRQIAGLLGIDQRR
jgi:hypothetical protein